MTIADGSTASADEVMDLSGMLFQNLAQVLYNGDYAGWASGLNNTGAPNLNNVVFETGQETIDTTNSNGLSIDTTGEGSIYFLGTLYDEYNGVVDATKWSDVGATSGTLSETTTHVRDHNGTINGNIKLRAHGLSLNPTATEGQLTTKMSMGTTSNSGANGTYTILQLRDDSDNLVQLAARSQGSWNGTFTYNVVLTRIDADTIRVQSQISGYTGAVYSDSNIDVSSLDNSGDWVVQANVYSTGSGSTGSQTITWENMLYAINSNIVATEGDTFTTLALDTSTTFTDAIPTANMSSSNVTLSLSADGGSNYETVTNSEILRITNTGADLRLKAVASGTGLNALLYINEYAVWYNTGAV